MPLVTNAPSAEALARKPRDDEIDVFGLTHTGKVRKTNNDHFMIASLHKRMDVLLTSLPGLEQSSNREERVAIFGMIADGVGGGETGEEASRIALDTATDYLATSLQAYYGASDKEGMLEAALQEAAMRSHGSVVRRAKERNDSRKRATTLTVIVAAWPWLYLLQVGDSRYYIFRDGELKQISRDQTYAQDLVDAGAMTRSQAVASRLKNVLSSAIGGDTTAPVVTKIASHWHNVQLGCSDGLTKHVTDDQIRERITNMTSAKQLCEVLLQDALEDGGTDNITILVARTVMKDSP